MKNIILVEGKDDKAFIEALIPSVETKPITVEKLEGLNQKALIDSLDAQKINFQKKLFDKLGIILDQDDFTKAERLAFVNKAIEKVFGITLTDTSTFISVEINGDLLQIACYFVNFEGKGELESLLTRIKTQPSPHADCLNQWQNCLKENKVSQKEFDKLWVHYYLKYDTSTHQERQQASKYCSLEYSLTRNPPVWNLASPILDELKAFLDLF